MSSRMFGRGVALLIALSSTLMAGCDPGLDALEVASQLRPSYLTSAEVADVPVGCQGLVDDSGGVWTAIRLIDRPGFVVVEHDGVPICQDAEQDVLRRAAKLSVQVMTSPAGNPNGPDGVAAMSRPGQDEHTISGGDVGDDPIPVDNQKRVVNTANLR